jgi:hypothetical protein
MGLSVLFQQPHQVSLLVALAIGSIVGYIVARATTQTTTVDEGSLLSLMNEDGIDGWNKRRVYYGNQTETHFKISTNCLPLRDGCTMV